MVAVLSKTGIRLMPIQLPGKETPCQKESSHLRVPPVYHPSHGA